MSENTNNNGKQFYGHEEANLHAMEGAMEKTFGKELTDQIYQTLPGTPSFSQQYGNNGDPSLRYASEQVQNYNNQPQQGNPQFSGYGQSAPSYGTSHPREWKMEADGVATSQYYDRLPKVQGRAITAVRKNGRGNIQAFQLEDGTILDYAQMLNASINNQVSGLRVQGNREGELIIRSVPDGFTDNNLDNLPNF